MPNKCISVKNFEETCDIYPVSNNIEIFMVSDTDIIIDKLFKSLWQIFQDAEKKPNEKGSEFIYENVDLLYYILHKTSLKKTDHISSLLNL